MIRRFMLRRGMMSRGGWLDREVLCMDGNDDVSSAVCRESQTWNEMTHLLECPERSQDCKADDTLNHVLSGDGNTFIGTVKVIDCGIRLRVFVELKQLNSVKLRSSRRRQQGRGEGDA